MKIDKIFKMGNYKTVEELVMKDIETILRDRMVFLCNSIRYMLGEENTSWHVFFSDNKDFPSLCGYEITQYSADNEVVNIFYLTLRKSKRKGKFIINCNRNDKESNDFVCSTEYVASEYVALHEFISAA